MNRNVTKAMESLFTKEGVPGDTAPLRQAKQLVTGYIQLHNEGRKNIEKLLEEKSANEPQELKDKLVIAGLEAAVEIYTHIPPGTSRSL